ncbi:hypothetical protein TNCV_4918151 [Trichonephila clavipes]|nr:hypothetical protein TNCV_4918151 [Trichonephila clavipes]
MCSKMTDLHVKDRCREVDVTEVQLIALICLMVYRTSLKGKWYSKHHPTIIRCRTLTTQPIPAQVQLHEELYHRPNLCRRWETKTATAGLDVVQSGSPIFDDLFQNVWPYIGNNTVNVVFQMVKRLWLIRIDQ